MSNSKVVWRGSDYAKLVQSEIGKRLDRIANRYEREINEAMREPKTGKIYRAESSVSFTTGEGKTVAFTAWKGKKHGDAGVHQASAPGEAPAIDSGRLKQSITREAIKEGNTLAVVLGTQLGNEPYSLSLEFGTSKMAPRPMWRPAFQRVQKLAMQILGGKFEGNALGSGGKTGK